MLDKASFQWICKSGSPSSSGHVLPPGRTLNFRNFCHRSYISKQSRRMHSLWIGTGGRAFISPPLTQILKGLNQSLTFKGPAIFVAPRWPAHSWFPLHQSLAKACHHTLNPCMILRVGNKTYSCLISLKLHLHASRMDFLRHLLSMEFSKEIVKRLQEMHRPSLKG